MARKYFCVRQHGEEDCGAACMATVAASYGRTIPISEAREAVGVGQLGTTLLGLRRGAELLGLKARQVRASAELLDQLSAVPLPAIIHWKGHHWVVLHGMQRGSYVVADPAVGIRRLTLQELREAWNDGLMLLLEPDEAQFWEQAIQPKPKPSVLRRLRPYRKLLLESLGLNLAIGLVSLSIPYLIQVLTDDVLVGGDRQMLTIFAVAAAGLTLFRNVLEWIQQSLVVYVAKRFELSLTLDFGRQILRLPLLYYESRNSGEITTRLQDIQSINQLLIQTLVILPSQGFTALVSLGLITFYSPQLAWVALGFILLIVISILLVWPTLREATRTELAMSGENQGLLIETFKGAITLKTMQLGPQIWDELQARLGRLAKHAFRTIQFGNALGLFTQLLMGLDTVAVLWIGGHLVIGGQLSIGQLLAVHSLNQTLTLFLISSVRWVDEFSRVRSIAERVLDVIETQPEQEGQAKLPFVELPAGEPITCSNLTFCHSGRTPLLQDLSLKIPGGQTTALIGESGCGKSTVVKLIAGLYPLQTGNIAFGPYSQQDIALDCLRQQVCLVSQDAHFWRRSVLENFQLVNPHLTFEQVVAACQLAQAHDFISELPQKYQTVIGEFGSNLSGGQRQRIALARALVQNPAVLILDESTSALDPVTEARVLGELLRDRQGKTTILISHRPSVIGRADWVVFLEAGRVKIQGHPKDLMTQPGDHSAFLT